MKKKNIQYAVIAIVLAIAVYSVFANGVFENRALLDSKYPCTWDSTHTILYCSFQSFTNSGLDTFWIDLTAQPDSDFIKNNLPAISNVTAIYRKGTTSERVEEVISLCNIEATNPRYISCKGFDSGGYTPKSVTLYFKDGGFNDVNSFCAINDELYCNGEVSSVCSEYTIQTQGLINGQCGYEFIGRGSSTDTPRNYTDEVHTPSTLKKIDYILTIMLVIAVVVFIVVAYSFIKRYY